MEILRSPDLWASSLSRSNPYIWEKTQITILKAPEELACESRFFFFCLYYVMRNI